MEARQLTNSADFIERCNLRIKLRIEHELSVQSLPVIDDEPHVPISESSLPIQNSINLQTLMNMPQAAITYSDVQSLILPAMPASGPSAAEDFGPLFSPIFRRALVNGAISSESLASGSEGQGILISPALLESADSTAAFQYRTKTAVQKDPNGRLSTSNLCLLCYEHRSNIKLLNCGHIAICSNCAEGVSNCPIRECNRAIVGTEPAHATLN